MRVALARASGWLMLVCSAACTNNDAERAAQSARVIALEREVRRLDDTVRGLKAVAESHGKPPIVDPATLPEKAFKLVCPQPWMIHRPLGATLWSCRAPAPAPEGVFPQCSVVWERQVAIETKNYFEYALNAGPQLFSIKNLKDQRMKVADKDGWEATFDADPKPVPLRMMSALRPHHENTFAVTCFAPAASFDKYAGGFRKIIDSFEFIKY